LPTAAPRPFDDMRWEVLSGESPNAFWDTWGRLLTGSRTDNPLLCATFPRLSVEYFAGGEPCFVVGHEGGEAFAAGILRPGRFGVWESFSPSQLPICPFVFSSRDARPDLGRLMRVLPGTNYLVALLRFDERYQGVDLSANRHRDTIDYARTISIEGHASFETYWGSRPKKLRDNLRRYDRRIEKEGHAQRFTVLRSASELEPAVTRYGDLESAGWKGRGGTALHASNTQGKFYTQLMREYAGSEDAFAFELYFGERLVASRLAIRSGRTMVFLKTTFAEEYRKLATGRLLLYRTVENLLGEGHVERLEFYTKADADFSQWATDSRPLHHVNCFRNGLWRGVAAAGRVARSLVPGQ